MVFGFILLGVIGGQCPHKSKVHIETLLALGSVNSRPLCGLFPDSCLCLEVNEPKGVMIKLRWDAQNIARKKVELGYASGSKLE